MIEVYSIIRPMFQPLIGAFHGWFATRMVVVMLFRPHKTYYFPITKKRVPFTPGIFPSRKKDLARNIGRTVTESLLTPEDIRSKIDAFITKENLQVIVSETVDAMMDGFKSTDNLQKLANSLGSTIPDMLDSAASVLVDRLISDHNRQLSRLSDFLVSDVFLNIKISNENAEKVVDYFLNNIVSPSNIRVSLHDALTPERAVNLQMLMRDRTTGALKFILALVNLESIFNNLKQYLQNEPEKSETLITEMIQQLKIREDLINRIVSLDFKKLSFEHVESFKQSLNSGIKHYLSNNRDKIKDSLGNFKENISEIIHNQIVNFTPSNLKPETIISIKTEITGFLYTYLKSEMANLVNKGITALKPREMIEGKIEAYSSQDVENLILGIMKKELKNLEVLGLLIGLILGISALAIEYFLPYQ